ncbi:TcpD family membrane protein [Lactococcus garvieae]|uniref:TcpD family membrane protein n=1 Tax=Lactococcus garvieae TaxID=1363 RepID=UPI003D787CBC
MSFASIKTGLISLLFVGAVVICFKAWKEGKWVEIFTTLGIGGIFWALLTGKDLFAMAWKVVTAILGVFGLKA